MRNKICDICGEGELVEFEPSRYKCTNCGKPWCSLPEPIAEEVERIRKVKKKRRG